MQDIIHIIKAESAPCSSLQSLTELPDHCCRLPQNVNFTDINIVELADLKVEAEPENGTIVRAATLSFQVRSDASVPERRAAFRLTGADGRRFILGSYARPYPIIKSSTPFPGRADGSRLRSFTVTLRCADPLRQIVL